MSKKDKKRKIAESITPITFNQESISILSKRGWKIVLMGIFVLVLGFICLSFADSKGSNWASHLSPFLIIVAYVLIGCGILIKDPS